MTNEAISASQGHDKRGIRGFFATISVFLSQVIAELKKVVTPNRQELIRYTLVVLAFVVIVMGIVYGLDLVFSWMTTVVFGVPI